ncbi:MAG: shikimate kinase [Desulfobacteraceae bacterium]|jgi:shikimate kinase|nr:shikimate kinase [Desulfobacteraceae bacterium]
MNMVLIGYRGTGKSEVGAIVADRLKMTCVGMDAEIVRRAGISIPEIVEKFGWARFRDMETEVAVDFSARDHLIIDTGGGVIERPENIAALQKNGIIFWLKATVDVIVSRIADDTQRPALVEGKTFTEEIAEVLERRISKYENAAQFEIDTDHLTPDQVAEQIVSMWQNKP